MFFANFCKEVLAKRQSGEVAEWLMAADCKSARVAYVGSNPTLTTMPSSCFHNEAELFGSRDSHVTNENPPCVEHIAPLTLMPFI